MDEAQRLKGGGIDSVRVNHNLQVVHNELIALVDETGIHPGQVIRLIKPEYFTPLIQLDVEHYLDSLNYIYQAWNSLASREKDEIYSKFEIQVGGKDALLQIQNDYMNHSISNLALNRNQLHKIIEINERLIQRMDPIFEKPDSKFGRAHMYAPVKRIGRWEIDTYWFNLLIIWIMSLIAYQVLYFNLLQRFASAINSFHIRRLDRIRKRIQARKEK